MVISISMEKRTSCLIGLDCSLSVLIPGRTIKDPILYTRIRTRVYRILSEYWNDDRIQDAIKQNGNLSKIGEDSLYTEVAGGVNPQFAKRLKMINVDNKININLTKEEVVRLEKYPLTISVKKINHSADNAIFPHIEKIRLESR